MDCEAKKNELVDERDAKDSVCQGKLFRVRFCVVRPLDVKAPSCIQFLKQKPPIPLCFVQHNTQNCVRNCLEAELPVGANQISDG
jgi:hypothetical protein